VHLSLAPADEVGVSLAQQALMRGVSNKEGPMIPESHPLQQLFLELVSRNFSAGVGLRNQEVSEYVAALLTEFCEIEQLYKIRNAAGRPLDDAGELLLESDPIYGDAPSFDRERQVRKHIGDYTLFFTGMFPESINRFRLRRKRMDGFIDFIKAGKESYYIVSKFEFFEYAKVAPLFARLSQEFERCVYGLNLVKNELQEMQHPIYRRTSELLM
jgi:hypothetical protein